MNIPLSDAKGRLTELVRRAEAGDEIVLTRHGQPVARIVPIELQEDLAELRARRRKALEAFRGCAKGKPGWEGVTAENATDFLYDEHGFPA
jgi:prevent-host-death family protein